MDIYQLTERGERLSHNIRSPRTAGWKVIYFLRSRGTATKEQIMEAVPEVTGHKLYDLRRKGVIVLVGQRVNISG